MSGQRDRVERVEQGATEAPGGRRHAWRPEQATVAPTDARDLRRRMLLLVLAAAVLLAQVLLGAAAPAGACACGAFVDPEGERSDASVTEETAILSLRDGVQTIVLGLELDAVRTGSALILPTPAVPEVSAASAGTLREMAVATAPREEVELELFGPPPWSRDGAGAAPTGAPGETVTVHTESRVGDFDVAVIEGDAQAVRDWLDANGYALPEPVGALLEPYAEDGWVFSAVRYAADAELAGDVDPLRFDFPAEELVYPVRLSQAATAEQSLHLFVLAPEPVARTDAGTAGQEVTSPWIADPEGAGWTWTDDTLRELTGADASGPDGAGEAAERPRVVTEFEIRGTPETFTTDLTFAEDPGIEHVVPTTTRVEVVRFAGIGVGYWLVGLASALGVVTVIALLTSAGWLRARRRR